MLILPILVSALAFSAPATAAVSPAAGSADSFALQASRVHVGDGRVIENGVIVVTDGAIRSVGASAPEGLSVRKVDGEIAPGFIAMRDATGADSENNETTRKFTPTADVARAFDPHHPAWAHLVSEGITTVVMTPASDRIAGGLDAIVSPATGEIVKRGVALHLGMSSRSISNFVEPTSYAGLYAHLDRHFADAADGSPFAQARSGATRVMMEALSKNEVARAVAFAKQYGLTGAIIGAPEAGDQVDLLKSSGLGVVFEPLDAGDRADVAESAKALRAAGVPFAFASDAGTHGPAAMRMTAATCMRRGLDAQGALAAMTKTAADMLGVSASHGTLEVGKVADFVVWSGAPTDLTSRATHVFAGGKLVHESERSSSHHTHR
ncbi:Imidazolonepropionase [Planctomycetes bacterium Poly30]|uniref:Imidazolonepropionase n=1 Tax=Saltatorellus ferox TaxID=2528018 RepID=A0A518EYF0_9BACT|nr:Imidazolonepropionase [Planctomycetes bacterium Poly30]